jgi:hypothetical protein
MLSQRYFRQIEGISLYPVSIPLYSRGVHSMSLRDSALTRTQEYAGNVIVLRCIPHEAVEVNHDAIQ